MWLLSIAHVLTVVATGAQPGISAGNSAGELPEPISTRQTYFAIPFEIDQVDHPTLGAAEIQLYTSRDRGATWQHETSVAPTAKQFLFRAASDGEYWFAVRTRDRAGNFRPSLVSAPGLRVVVDTKAPALSIEAQRGQAGQIVAKWKIDEANIKPETLKLQYRLGESHQWEDIALDPSAMRTDASISSGESTWWAPAGQGRIEIRAEVADAAGNRNVSHAQVTTVASAATPSMDSMAQTSTSQYPASPAAPQGNWQASAGQNSWSQQNNYANQPSASQGPSATNSYGQDDGGSRSYGYDGTQMAGESASGANYGAGSSYGDSSGYGTQSQYGTRNQEPVGSGGQGNGYGVDANMTAQNPTSAVTPNRSAGQSTYGQYAESAPSYGQQYQQNGSSSGYGSPSSPESNSTWTNEYSRPTQDRSGMGTVAAQPAPAYQNQYNPGGAVSQDRGQQASSSHGTGSSYGNSRQNSAANNRPIRTVNTNLVEIAYSNPAQPLAVGRVEVWGTRDGGSTWKSYGFDSDSRSPILTRVPEEGTYGFNVVFHPLHGQPAQPPRRGQTPDMLIRVDLTRPDTRLIGIDPVPGRPEEMTIRWQASDAELAEGPISLFYADAATGQWRPIAQNVENSGDYRWRLPAGLPAQVQIRVDARDVAGNVASVETRTPVQTARRPQTQRGVPPYSVQVQDVHPVGESNQAAPRRYIIR